MRVLVTGIGGFIGQNVAKYLTEKGKTVVGVCHKTRPSIHVDKVYAMDLSKDDLEDKLNGECLDAIIHFAGQMKGNRIEDYLENTVTATQKLLQYAEKKQVGTFLYASSISVYGETEGAVHEESDRRNPDDYGMTKYICERLVEDSAINRRIVIRLPRTLGKGCDLSYPWLPKVAGKMKENADIYFMNPELMYNNLAYIDDVAAFIEKQLEDSGKGFERYVLGAKDKYRIIDILKILKKCLHSTSRLIETQGNGKNKCFAIDTTLAEEHGFLSRPTDEILKQFAEDVIRGNQ